LLLVMEAQLQIGGMYNTFLFSTHGWKKSLLICLNLIYWSTCLYVLGLSFFFFHHFFDLVIVVNFFCWEKTFSLFKKKLNSHMYKIIPIKWIPIFKKEGYLFQKNLKFTASSGYTLFYFKKKSNYEYANF
jgi:hypothetical protein